MTEKEEGSLEAWSEEAWGGEDFKNAHQREARLQGTHFLREVF